jgi:type II secretory pathway pseudopilin PulG
MNPPPDLPREPRRFNAVPLLVLVVIALVLTGLFFPMIPSGGPSGLARKVKARQDALAIVHAVDAYYTEYGQYPKLDVAATGTEDRGDEGVGDTAAGMHMDNAGLFNILRAIDRGPNAGHTQNPKRQVFFSARAVSDPRNPRDGFLESATASGVQGALYDPWGTQFNIVLDANADNTIDVHSFYPELIGDAAPRVSVGVFSLGKDKKLGKDGDRKLKIGDERSDDIVSWPDEVTKSVP